MLKIFFAAMLGALSIAAPALAQEARTNPTVVLVHGAFAESSSWEGVAEGLLADGYPVIAVANPLRGVELDTDYLASVLNNVSGSIILVGHSYGGIVITNAAADASNVKALVYVAGLAPDAGESAADLVGKFPGGTLGEALAPPVPLRAGGQDLYIQVGRFHAQFAADLPAGQAAVMAATQRPIVASAFSEISRSAAWKTIPSWFIYGSLDRNIPAASHAFMAERARARQTVAIEGASHVVMISHADRVVKMIEDAAAGL